MQRTMLLLAAVLLCGCGKQTVPLRHPLPVPAPASSQATAERPLEQLPSELSIPYFSSMRLSGTGFTLGNPVSVTKSYSRYNISYRSNGLLITGILNIPSTPGPHPLLVFNHGYIDPAVYTRGRGLKREQDYMANNGFAVLHIDYRGHAGSDPSPMTAKVYDGNLEYAMDSANAVEAIRAAKVPGVDTAKVGMLGHSMGGGVTLAVLTGRPDLVDAAVLYAPVNGDVWQNFTRWRAKREEGDRTITEF
ncbi:MAG TPA: alpha/beta fold hydrolase, partial [Candidatus Peribacteria bacterium]|nr:alpha/beta fold hydrolase [Candidatus Peribacteria bacterium]